MKQTHKTVLSLLIPEDSENALIVRVGPRKVSCLIRWRMNQNVFSVGPWFRARIYSSACTISADGQHALIFLLNGHWDEENQGAWFSLMALPDFKTLANFPIGDLFGNQAGFLNNEHYWVRQTDENRKINPRGLKVQRVNQPVIVNPNKHQFRQFEEKVHIAKGEAIYRRDPEPCRYQVNDGVLFERKADTSFSQIADFRGMEFGDTTVRVS